MIMRKSRAQIPADEDGEYDEKEAQGPADDPGYHAQVLLQIQYQDPLVALRGGGFGVDILKTFFITHKTHTLLNNQMQKNCFFRVRSRGGFNCLFLYTKVKPCNKTFKSGSPTSITTG